MQSRLRTTALGYLSTVVASVCYLLASFNCPYSPEPSLSLHYPATCLPISLCPVSWIHLIIHSFSSYIAVWIRTTVHSWSHISAKPTVVSVSRLFLCSALSSITGRASSKSSPSYPPPYQIALTLPTIHPTVPLVILYFLSLYPLISSFPLAFALKN